MNKMIEFALVEDEILAQNHFKECFHRFFKESDLEVKLSVFQSGNSFLSTYQKSKYDAIFLDINLEGISGFDLAKEIRKQSDEVIIVFVTNLANYAIKGYEVETFDFLVKPFEYEQFKFKMNRVMKKLVNAIENQSILIKIKNDQHLLNLKDVAYIEKEGHTVTFHMGDKTLYTVYGSLSKIEKEIIEDKKMNCFIKIHSYLIVNLHFVTSLHGYFMDVNGDELPVSQPKRKNIAMALTKFINENEGI